MIIYQKKKKNSYVDTNTCFYVFKSLENLKKKIPKKLLKLCLFVSLPPVSLQFQRQLMTKSETRLDFKPLGNH